MMSRTSSIPTERRINSGLTLARVIDQIIQTRAKRGKAFAGSSGERKRRLGPKLPGACWNCPLVELKFIILT